MTTSFFYVRPDVAQRREDMKAALESSNARRVFRRLLGWCNVMGQSWATDGHSSSYNEGLRAAGLWLAQEIEAARPGELAQLMRESADECAEEQAAKKGAGGALWQKAMI